MLILKQYSWFYSHLGHCSLGGTLKCLIQNLPQVFVYHLLSINCISFLLQTSHHDIYCLHLSGVGQVGEGDGLAVGEPHHLHPITTVPHTLHYSSRAVLPYQPQGLGRETDNLPCHCLPVNTSWEESHWAQEIWSIDHIGEPLWGQSLLLHGRCS